jgi:hypothetical protein
VRAHEAALLRLAYLLCRDSGRAEDLVQDALVRVLRRWRQVGVPDSPFGYVRKVVITEYLAWRRLRSATERVGPVEGDEVPDPAAEVADRVADRQLPPRPCRHRPTHDGTQRPHPGPVSIAFTAALRPQATPRCSISITPMGQRSASTGQSEPTSTSTPTKPAPSPTSAAQSPNFSDN